MLDDPHPDVSKRDMSYVLSRWRLMGLYTEPNGRQSWNYYAMVRRLGRVVRVAVSLDDSTVITAFKDRSATVHWQRGNLAYFSGKLSNLQDRGFP